MDDGQEELGRSRTDVRGLRCHASSDALCSSCGMRQVISLFFAFEIPLVVFFRGLMEIWRGR